MTNTIKKKPAGQSWNEIPARSPAASFTTDQIGNAVSSAIKIWKDMGLTDEQITYGLANLHVESGFSFEAHNDIGGSHDGFGQFSKATLVDAVKYYKTITGKIINTSDYNTNPDTQLRISGAWIKNCWNIAENRLFNDPAFKKYSKYELVYSVHHEGINKSSQGLLEFLGGNGSNQFNTGGVGKAFNHVLSIAPDIINSDTWKSQLLREKLAHSLALLGNKPMQAAYGDINSQIAWQQAFSAVPLSEDDALKAIARKYGVEEPRTTNEIVKTPIDSVLPAPNFDDPNLFKDARLPSSWKHLPLYLNGRNFFQPSGAPSSQTFWNNNPHEDFGIGPLDTNGWKPAEPAAESSRSQPAPDPIAGEIQAQSPAASPQAPLPKAPPQEPAVPYGQRRIPFGTLPMLIPEPNITSTPD